MNIHVKKNAAKKPNTIANATRVLRLKKNQPARAPRLRTAGNSSVIFAKLANRAKAVKPVAAKIRTGVEVTRQSKPQQRRPAQTRSSLRGSALAASSRNVPMTRQRQARSV